jgi:hypothetical protein
MRHLWLITYEYREGLGKDGFRDLQEKFRAVGQAPGVIAHYVRLDRKGGFAVWEAPEDPESTFEYLLQFEPWTKGEVIPITTVEDAFPVIQRWIADDSR